MHSYDAENTPRLPASLPLQGTRLLAVACLLGMFGISSLPLTYVLQGLFMVGRLRYIGCRGAPVVPCCHVHVALNVEPWLVVFIVIWAQVWNLDATTNAT
jgi:hypothetical protein